MIFRLSDLAFLAFDFGRFIRNMPAWLSVVVVLGVLAGIGAAVYFYYRLKEMGDEEAPPPVQGAQLQERREEKRERVLQERSERMKDVPSGRVERVKLPPATLKIRNRVEKIPSDREFTVGKMPDSSLVISELGVSRNHAKIRPEKIGYVIYDLASSHGTFVNGKKITKFILHDNDQIKIGPENLVFNVKK